MLETDVETLLIIIFIYLVGFISGFFVRASFSQSRAPIAPEPWHARLTAAEGEPRHDGKKRSMNLPAVVTALVVISGVSGVIVLDHFKGPLFPDALYCLNDGGTQTMRMCTPHRSP